MHPRNIALSRAVVELRGRSGRVLEAGAGTARFLRALRTRFPHLQGYACDIALPGLLLARRHDSSLEVAQGNLTALPFKDSSFDIALVFDVLEHLGDPACALREIRRVLVPGGLLHGLVPCEGQPGTLHWLLWKANVAADLKEKRVGHVQRFTHSSLRSLLESNGLKIDRVTYSMHWLGQAQDILTYLQQEPGFPGWLAHSPLYRLLTLALWACAYMESHALHALPVGAVALHLTAIKR